MECKFKNIFLKHSIKIIVWTLKLSQEQEKSSEAQSEKIWKVAQSQKLKDYVHNKSIIGTSVYNS